MAERVISKNFSEAEVACKCCKKVYITPTAIKALQELRDLINKPIKVLRGYSCVKHNKEVGGAPDSQHIRGNAFDITVDGWTVPQMYESALQIHDFFEGGIGVYPDNGFIHVDVRNGKARWGRIKKKVKGKVQDVYVSVDEAFRKTV